MGQEDSGPAVDDSASDASEDDDTLDDFLLGAYADASLVAVPTTPAVVFPSSGSASGRSSFSSYHSVSSSLTDVSESDSEAARLSHCTTLSRSLGPPEVEEIEESYPWLATPTAQPSTPTTARAHRSSDAVQGRKFKGQWLLELRSKRDRLDELMNMPFIKYDLLSPDYGISGGLLDPISRARLVRKDASDLLSKIQTGSIFFRIFGANIIKVVSRLDEAIQDLSWLIHLFEDDSDHNKDGELVPPLARNEPSLFLVWSQIAKVYHASRNNKKLCGALSSITCNYKLFSGNQLRLCVRVLRLLLPALQCKDVAAPLLQPMIRLEAFPDLRDLLKGSDGMVGAMAAYAERNLFYDGAFPNLLYVLKGGNEMVRAVATYAISELAAYGLAVQSEFVEKDFIPILLERLTSFNKSRMLRNQLDIHAHAAAVDAWALWKLCKAGPTYTRSIIGSELLFTCLSRLSDLEDESPESRLASLTLFTEITNAFIDKEDGLGQFFTAIYKGAKGICDNLRSIANGVQGDNFPNVVPRIIAFTCRSKAFNGRSYSDVYFYEGWQIAGTLIHILETRYPGIVGEETAVMLAQNIPVRSLLHDPEIQPPELVIICCITKYLVAFGEPESMLDIRALLEWASEEAYLTKDATIKRLMLEAKSKLDEI